MLPEIARSSQSGCRSPTLSAAVAHDQRLFGKSLWFIYPGSLKVVGPALTHCQVRVAVNLTSSTKRHDIISHTVIRGRVSTGSEMFWKGKTHIHVILMAVHCNGSALLLVTVGLSLCRCVSRLCHRCVRVVSTVGAGYCLCPLRDCGPL